MKEIPFVRPYLTGQELNNLEAVLKKRHLHGDGFFTEKCHKWLESAYGAPALLTHSCTAALEMAAILSGIGIGDEVIMPSFTFVSTANAFVLRGAVPVFVDIRPDTLNIDERLLEQALSPRTRAIAVVHYAGVACEMDSIMSFAEKHKLIVIEDAAQAIESSYKNKKLGSFGRLAAFSFHQTKNIVSGEGGALIINDRSLLERAYIIREKGTNRTQFQRGEVSKYEWLDIGSSYLPSELIAAVLFAQLEQAEEITRKRLALWNLYHELLEEMESREMLRRPIVPKECQHNAHIYYVLLNKAEKRKEIIDRLRSKGITATSHYVPLHSSPAGRKFGRTAGSMAVTEKTAESILRLPLFPDMQKEDAEYAVNALYECFN